MVLSRRECGLLAVPGIKKFWNNKKNENASNYNGNPKLCKNCESVISYEKRRNNFCSHSCAASYNNIGNRKHGKSKSNCVICGNQLSQSNCVHCKSGSCTTIYAMNEHIKTGFDFKHKIGKMLIRKYYIVLRGHKCEECELSEWRNKPIPLELHHNDGDANNNTPENVKLMCRNCYAQTDTFCGKNKGKSTRKRLYSLV
jgi:hypothetical protein